MKNQTSTPYPLTRIRVGVFFGGPSREREVSFAGGRTVYDNLDKSLFEAVPIFVDEFGNLCLLDWQFIYRGTIRDFYPPVKFLPQSESEYQIYGESLAMSTQERRAMLSEIGSIIRPDDLKDTIDIAFLALHGEKGEDGSIQGLLEWYGIPYTGSGILPSAFGVNKAVQKRWMQSSNFNCPSFLNFHASQWQIDSESIYDSVLTEVGFPLVVKAANQGSSIGVHLLFEEDKQEFFKAVDLALFKRTIYKKDWENVDKVAFIREMGDLRSGLGFPLKIDNERVLLPSEAKDRIEQLLLKQEYVLLAADKSEVEIVIESLLEGREFSCIVLGNGIDEPIALPPTEIVKKKALFDYKSKYLPGLSRKVTPIPLETKEVQKIREACSSLYKHFEFNVYARIDGFYTPQGDIYLNDPNTTSGMMPSSFFFHQAAEVGLNPSQFLSFILRSSISARLNTLPSFAHTERLLTQFDMLIASSKENAATKKKVGIILGGYSTERHISVESGRNIFEKLSSSVEYEPVPIFLTGSDDEHHLYELPVNILLKDNADDIKHKVEHFSEAEIISQIANEASGLSALFGSDSQSRKPQKISYAELAKKVDQVFIALHGRPGEDGAVQVHLNKLRLPYNGSGVDSSAMTINKYQTNNLLRSHGFLVADNLLVSKADWNKDKNKVLSDIAEMGFPLIAKPSDEGCSSAVLKINNPSQFCAYTEIAFREDIGISQDLASELSIDVQDEFPSKGDFLVEKFIDRNNADHFLEITGGMLTSLNSDGNIEYEIFEPSEALSEGAILSLAEKFLAGEGQNITPARFSADREANKSISRKVRDVFERVAKLLNIEGYCRIDAFVRIFNRDEVEVVIIEINSLPGMTPATCIYHQASINGYKPFDFIDKILSFGEDRLRINSIEKVV